MKQKFFDCVIRFRIPIMVIFVLAAVWGAYAKQLVQVNYDMNDYLPEESSSTVSMDKMQEEFDGGIPNARVAVKDVSYAQALKYKEKLEKIKGVEEVTWLDDVNYLDMPIDMLSKDTRDLYYKDNTALYTVTIGEDSINSAVPEIRKVIGDDNAMTGSAVSTAEATSSTVSEIKKIAVIAVLIVLLVLCLTTSSWLEPFIVLLGIGVAVLINAGTNLMFGEVSFVTNAAGSILQLAVSLDYSVFLIHRFQECRMTCNSPKEAMNEALCKSASSILSSGLTTVIGFLALLFMRFGIGPDLGRALAKGIGISLLTVFLFMPGIILFCYRLMDKLSHRRLLPSFEKFGKLVSKITIPLAILFCVLMLPTFYASNNNSYYYGSSHIFGAGTRYGDDTKYIEDTFGIKDTYVLMVKNNDMKKEKALVKELKKSDKILSITALSDMLGPMLPRDMIPNTIRKKLESENYSRMVLSVGVDYEGEETFALVEKIRNTAAKYYGNNYYLAGQGVSTYDLMDTITDDMVKVNLVAIAAVLIVLILTMRQIKTPIVLVLAIETAIWINLSIPYLQNTPLFYIAYLIISSVQLGATVDYAILFSDRYRECRREMDKKESIIANDIADFRVHLNFRYHDDCGRIPAWHNFHAWTVIPAWLSAWKRNYLLGIDGVLCFAGATVFDGQEKNIILKFSCNLCPSFALP